MAAIAIAVVDPTDRITADFTSNYGKPASTEAGRAIWSNDLSLIRVARSPEGTLVYWVDTPLSWRAMSARARRKATSQDDATDAAAKFRHHVICRPPVPAWETVRSAVVAS